MWNRWLYFVVVSSMVALLPVFGIGNGVFDGIIVTAPMTEISLPYPWDTLAETMYYIFCNSLAV